MRLRVGCDLGQSVDSTAIVVCEVATQDVGAPTMAGGLNPANLNPLSPMGLAMSGEAGGVTPLDHLGNRLDVAHVPTLPAERPSAVAEPAERRPADEALHIARSLERIKLGTSYLDVAVRIRRILEWLRNQHPRVVPELYVDNTGVGIPVVDILRRELVGVAHTLVPVTFVSGDGYHDAVMPDGRDREGRTPPRSSRGLRVGKGFLVSRLQAMLQTGRLVLPDTPPRMAEMAEALKSELRDFQVTAKVSHDVYGAKSGAHDDLVTAAGLAVLDRPRQDVRAVVELNAGFVDPGRIGFGGPANAWDLPIR